MSDERHDNADLVFMERGPKARNHGRRNPGLVLTVSRRPTVKGHRRLRPPVNENEAVLVWADEYSRMAEAYDRDVVPYFEPMARRVVDVAAPKSGELLLDLATGTGLLACLLAPRVAPQSIVAIDLADGALSVASHRAGALGLRNIRFEMLDIRNIVYRGNLFDGAVCSFGIPAVGFGRVFGEVFRVLKPGGRFAFAKWGEPSDAAVSAVDDLLAKYGTRSPSKRLGEIRAARAFTRDHPDYKPSFDARSLGAALERVGFREIGIQVEVANALFAPPERYLDLRLAYGENDQEVAEMDSSSREAFRGDVIARLRELARDGVLTVAWKVHYLSARKP